MPPKTRILIVDDSRCFRSALEEALAGQEDIAVVGSVWNGQKALEFVQQAPPEVVVLDLAMPGMDGLETLRAIQQVNATRQGSPPIRVILVSAYLDSRTEAAAQARQGGAVDVIAKPSGPSHEANILLLSQLLLGKIRNQTQRRLSVSAPPSPQGTRRRPASRHFRAVLIAVSTGGPEALAALLPPLSSQIDQPILIVQHMMPGMLAGLVQTLANKCSRPVVEARDGAPIVRRHIYFAPIGHHLVLRHDAAGEVIARLTDQPPEHSFRPSANVLFRSAAHVWGGDVLVLILTGMLDDGTAGLDPLKRNGAYVIAQDQASSVVWGMPRSAVDAGLVDEVVPLDRMAAVAGAVINSSRRE